MTDRELLELAAKAAGKTVTWHGDYPTIAYTDDEKASLVGSDCYRWNPITDDGDALRLAVKLEIDVWHGKWPNGKKYAAAHRVWCPNDSMYYDDGVAYKNDKEAATRRAIVRAAAEIGRGME